MWTARIFNFECGQLLNHFGIPGAVQLSISLPMIACSDSEIFVAVVQLRLVSGLAVQR